MSDEGSLRLTQPVRVDLNGKCVYTVPECPTWNVEQKVLCQRTGTDCCVPSFWHLLMQLIIEKGNSTNFQHRRGEGLLTGITAVCNSTHFYFQFALWSVGKKTEL